MVLDRGTSGGAASWLAGFPPASGCGAGLRWRRVDPDCRGHRGVSWRPPDEALGMCSVGEVERFLATGNDLLGASIVDIARRQEGDAAVVVLVVVPGEEGAAVLEP